MAPSGIFFVFHLVMVAEVVIIHKMNPLNDLARFDNKKT
jgi:hypothetical protein